MAIPNTSTIAVVGLGYVGLPLAIEFGKKFRTIGFDLSASKINSYQSGTDPTGEIPKSEFLYANKLIFTTQTNALSQADFIVIAVPTPVDEAHKPDFGPLISASISVGKQIKRGATVIYESTVYPGATEEVCVPILERESNLKWKIDFNVGYSPERINPGDREHSLTNIVKVVSGDTPYSLDLISDLYASIITRGIHRAETIKIAEAAKVIENTQRDLNIALMNELSIIFDRLNIDTSDVLKAASTKWNFLNFKPGLVGGHCIGVDPYYLTYKAEKSGYLPQVILSGRRINDGMGKFLAEKTIKLMINSGINIKGSQVIILGLTFKENCSDIRNSKVPDIIRELESYGVSVIVHDPIANPEESEREYAIQLTDWENIKPSEAVIVAVAHSSYVMLPEDMLREKLRPGGVFVDVKSVFNKDFFQHSNVCHWRL